MKMTRTGWILGLVVGGAAVAGLTYAMTSSASTPTPTPTPGGALPGVTTGQTVTLSPGAASYAFPLGTQVTVQLPPGATWINNGSGAATGNAFVAFVYQGPGTVNYQWTDSSGTAQTTALTMTTTGAAATPSGAANASYTLPPGTSGQATVPVAANGYVTLFLPSGGTWKSLTLQPSGTSVTVSGNQAATFQVSPSAGTIGSATAVWTDSNGSTWTDTISLPTS